jgi:glycogen debranching enzyme
VTAVPPDQNEVPGLGALLSPEGWAFASSLPVDGDDRGRFHALFGRDSLITALAVLPVRPDVARATLHALAALQGAREDPEMDEEPGKIVHEYRPRSPERYEYLGWPVSDAELRYYGSADGTAWFLIVLASLDDAALAAELEPAWRGAAGWLERALERGDGLLTHGPRRAPGGLAQQGWRDAVDAARPDGPGILRPDGTVPAPPLADADTQAVALVALRAAWRLSGEQRFLERHGDLAARVAERFGPDVMAVAGDGSAVEGAGSQLGWLLWSGSLPPDATGALARRLVDDDVLTPFGLRTLSSRSPVFDPEAYHRGGVWPFDAWLGWGGLRAAGRAAEAERVRTGVLDALDRLGDAPELYAVGPEGPRAVATSNRVQAWTVGARWALAARWDGRAAGLF